MGITRDELEKLIKRDEETYVKIYSRFALKVVMYVDSIIRNKEDAKDITSDIFINLPETANQNYDLAKGDFYKWLLGVAKMKCKEYFKNLKQKEYSFNEAIEIEGTNEPKNKFKIEELKSILTIEEYKIVILLYAEDFTLKEASKELEVGIFIARKLKNKALHKIEIYFKNNYLK